MAFSFLVPCHGVWLRPSSSVSEPGLANWVQLGSPGLRNTGQRQKGCRRSTRAMVPVCSTALVVFRDLDADDFRHPLDKQVISAYALNVFVKIPC